MSENTFGKIFKITTFGESHGKAMGVVIDGCPAGLEITQEEIQMELDKRRPGQDKLTSPRQEKDQVEILSGIFEGKTLGSPIAMVVYNEDAQSKSYEDIKDKYRPGHADFVYDQKYGFRDYRGGGRASARETLARVAGGAVAKVLLKKIGVEVIGQLIQVGKIKKAINQPSSRPSAPSSVRGAQVEGEISEFETAYTEEIEMARENGDSVGGVVEIVAKNLSIGLGSPVFDKLSADLAKALVSIPAVKGFEIGDGFACVEKNGSDNNDQLENVDGNIKMKTNHAGGIIGGISNGEDIIIRIALKPTSSISKMQKTVDKDGNEVDISVQGRHDPCVAIRAVPVAEAMVALTLVDHYLLNKISKI